MKNAAIGFALALVLVAVGFGVWLVVQTGEPDRMVSNETQPTLLLGLSSCEREYLEADRRVMNSEPGDIDDEYLVDRYGENAERMRDIVTQLQQLNALDGTEWTPTEQSRRMARIHCFGSR